MDFAPEQLKGIEFCIDIKRRVVAISGPAGSGKTTIIRRAVDHLRSKGRTVAIAAPTGRAARRIYEATGYPAITIHKLLEYGRPELDNETGKPKEVTHPARSRDKPLAFQDVIVDEYAMVNEELHRNLLDALPPGGRLLAFGDVAQLPPIEEYALTGMDGSPFERLLKLPSSVILTHVYRQLGDSGILYNATRIRNGQPPVKKNDFIINSTDIPLAVLKSTILANLEKGIDFSEVSNQVISPARRSALGVHKVNSFMQALYHNIRDDGVELPRDKWQMEHRVKVHIGEKVICNENLYDMRDFFDRYYSWDKDEPIWSTFIPCPDTFTLLNGEIGVVSDILPDGTIYLQMDDRTVTVPSTFRDYHSKYDRIYDRDPRTKLDLAYCVTTHKMQGSECDHVIYLMHRSISPNINRNNVYTAITRARSSVTIISDPVSLANGVRLTSAAKSKVMAANKEHKQGFKVGDVTR